MERKSGTVDAAEIDKFSRMSGGWWNGGGEFAALHRMNPVRIQWILDQATSVQDLALLDIGCGGGLICEPMKRLGARVTGIDASGENIEVARQHAKASGLEIDYLCTTAEALAENKAQFDIVLALEIVEHVADVAAFVEASCALVKPGGLVVFSTLNRTAKSFALAIVGAEYVLRMVPRGTHSFEKFLKPHELCAHLRASNVEVTDMAGLLMNPLSSEWRVDAKDVGVNYILAGRKQ